MKTKRLKILKNYKTYSNLKKQMSLYLRIALTLPYACPTQIYN